MSGRIRTIKPEILSDKKTATLDDRSWRVFVSSWVAADDYGNLRGEPEYVRAQLLWGTDATLAQVQAAITKLAEVGLFVSYTVRGQSYLHIAGWSKHQKVDKAGKPRMPGPADSDIQSIQGVGQDSRESRESLATDLRPPTSEKDPDQGPQTLDPARPKVSRQTKIRPDWTPSVPFDAEQLEAFRDYHTAKGSNFWSWDAAWRTWVRNAKKFAERDGRRPVGNASPVQTAMDEYARLEREEQAR